MSVRLLLGDCRDVLRTLPDESVHCVVTSPPYFGLRDYGVSGQIGLEPTPDAFVAEMVAVFGEVRRVMRPDATLWLNLGDSYTAHRNDSAWLGGRGVGEAKKGNHGGPGLKPKDLIGIPWSVAKALQAPYYTGRIKDERDRVWLAATIDAEGSICGFHHERKDDGEIRTGIHITITNSNMALLDNAHRIWTTSRADHNRHGNGHLGKLEIRRWIAHDVDKKSLLLRELYPHLIAKKQQAMLAWNFLEMNKDAKRLGHSPEAANVREKRSWIVMTLSKLNHAEHVDIPDWIQTPPSLFEPGFYLRQDIIWHKPNPMPESVTDRCTKAHEYMFLLSKSARYHFDAEAIAEEGAAPREFREETRGDGSDSIVLGRASRQAAGATGFGTTGTRNKRSVWTVATQPFSDWTETVRRERVERDAAVDGKKRTTSPDCPLHGDRDARASNAPCGERAGAPTRHSKRNGTGRDQGQLDDCAATETLPGLEIDQHNSDLPVQQYEPSASGHSTESHRTARDPATSPACTASAQIHNHIADTSGELALSGSADHTPASSNERDAMGDHLSAQMVGRNADSSSCGAPECTCEYYIEKRSKTSHFATFPPDLIEPCILAGCPKGGTVLDPFAGAGTTGLVADRLGRDAILIELNPVYAEMAESRIRDDLPLFTDVTLEKEIA